MRKLGFGLFVVGIIVASCFAARAVDPKPTEPGGQVTAGMRIGAWWNAAGWPFVAGMVLVVAGGIVARRKTSEEGEAADAGRSPEKVLGVIIEKLAEMPDRADEKNAQSLHTALDDVLERHVPDFLDARTAMIDRMGLGPFAEMISQFASFERNAGRAWSALTDEAFDEVGPCLERARAAAGRTQSLLEAGAKK